MYWQTPHTPSLIATALEVSMDEPLSSQLP